MRRCAFILAMLSLAATARADSVENYKQGVIAAEKKDWAEVVRRMQAAIAERPAESSGNMLIYGVHYEPYVPHYWLGAAYASLDDCTSALRELNESEKQAAIIKTKRYRDLQIAAYQCQKKVPVRETAPKTKPVDPQAIAAAADLAQKELDAASRAGSAVLPWRTDPEKKTLWSSDASFEDRYTRATGLVSTAKNRFESAKGEGNVADIKAAADAAAIARDEFQSLTRDLQRSADTAERQKQIPTMQSLQNDIVQRIVDARLAIAEAGQRKELARPVADLNRNVQLAAHVSEMTSITDLQQLRDALTSGTQQLQQLLAKKPAVVVAAAWPPAPLYQAAANFFAGNYQRVLTILGSSSFTDRKAQAHAAIFEGAAAYYLYLIGGSKNDALRQQAIRDVRRCRQLDSKLVPAIDDFSPRFLQFFASAAVESRGR
jgi:hypothetical protein